jgi:zinc transport system substrate-binding protein
MNLTRLSILALLCVVPAISLVSCRRAGNDGAPTKDAEASGTVIATFYPLEFFATRIAGGLVNVECPLPGDADPAYWVPDDATIARYQSADVILVNGAGFESWLTTATLPISRICDTSRPFKDQYVVLPKILHSHGSQGDHSHEGVDGHTWMDPANAVIQAEQVMLSLVRRYPANERAFRENLDTLQVDLLALDASLRELSPQVEKATLIAGHPAYNYLARRQGWSVSNIDLPGDAAPTEAQLAALANAIESSGGKPAILLLENEPLPEVVAAVARLKARAVVYRTAEALTPSQQAGGVTFITIMQQNIRHLAAALYEGRATTSIPATKPSENPSPAHTNQGN